MSLALLKKKNILAVGGGADFICCVVAQWLVMVLYGIAGALFAYCISLAVKSPLAAFAATAGYQIIYFLVGFLYFFLLDIKKFINWFWQ